MANKEMQNMYSALPRVDALLDEYEYSGIKREYLKIIINNSLEKVRKDISGGNAEDPVSDVRRYIDEYLDMLLRGTIRRVVNGTGVLLHTNLGRAIYDCPGIGEIASNYCNLEFDLETGERGSRNSHLSDLFSMLTGAEAAIAVNNNAAAVMLVLTALAKDKDVIVSRGEQVEIGGSFRIPEVAALSGALLREVGTTNRTRISDYKNAAGENTAMLLRVEPSNYKIIGQTGRASNEELSELSQEIGAPFYIDLGSGVFNPQILRSFVSEEDAERKYLGQAVKYADIVSFSGDKLLGSAQAGIIIGKKHLIQKLAKHPLYRAMRLDKLTIYALSRALISAIKGEKSLLEKMMCENELSIKARAGKFIKKASRILSEEWEISLQKLNSSVGGGTFAESEIASYGIRIKHSSFNTNTLAYLLRKQAIPIIPLIDSEYLYIDFRTISNEDEAILVESLTQISL